MSDYADNLRKSIINTGKKFTEMAEEVRRKQNEADREEILRMAREAGLGWDDKYHWYVGSEALERFAALVAAAEREACARLCADYTAWGREWGQDNNHMAAEAATNECAAAIRARGEK